MKLGKFVEAKFGEAKFGEWMKAIIYKLSKSKHTVKFTINFKYSC